MSSSPSATDDKDGDHHHHHHAEIEFDQAKAEEYDQKDHTRIFSQAVMDGLKTFEWFHEQSLEVLDFGCGTGTNAIAMARLEGSANQHKITAVDVSPNMLEQFRNKLTPESDDDDLRNRIQIIQAKPDGSFETSTMFDAIFTFFVLHHIPTEQRASVLARLVQVLKPGGRLVITEIDDTERVREVFAKHDKKKEQEGHNHTHEHDTHDHNHQQSESKQLPEEKHNDEHHHNHDHHEHQEGKIGESLPPKRKGEDQENPSDEDCIPEPKRNHHGADHPHHDHNHSSQLQQEEGGNHHDHNHHHGKYHWLHRDQVANMMKEAGIQSTTMQDLVIEHTEWTMDCYWVIGTR